MSEGAVMTERVTNTELGGLLDLSHVQVHRIRNGTRQPSIEAMVRIESVLAWPVADQVRARTSREYAEGFEAAVARYAAARNTDVGPEERSPTPHSLD
jgi:hypothetical protein